MAKKDNVFTFTSDAADERRDTIEFELVGIRRCIDGLQLACEGEQWSALRGYLVEHLQTHCRTLDKLLFPAG